MGSEYQLDRNKPRSKIFKVHEPLKDFIFTVFQSLVPAKIQFSYKTHNLKIQNYTPKNDLKKCQKKGEIQDLSRRNREKALWVIPSRVRKPTGSTRFSLVDEASAFLGWFCCFEGWFEEAEHLHFFENLNFWKWGLFGR